MRVAVLIAVILAIPLLTAEPGLPDRFERGVMPAGVMAAAGLYPEKVPAGFAGGADFVRDDGTMQVILNLDGDRATWAARMDAMAIPFAQFRTSADGIAHVTPSQVVWLIEHPDVVFVEPDQPLVQHLATSVIDAGARAPNAYDPRGVWALGDDGLEPAGALDTLYTGQGVTVAVIDSGIDSTHGDFGDWDCDVLTKLGCDTRIVHRAKVGHLSPIELGLPEDLLPTTEFASGHGTHVAGTVLGNGRMSRATAAPGGGDGHNLGVAPNARLVSLSVGDGLSAGLASFALDWVLAHHKEYDIKVTSNSYGCGRGCDYNPSSARAQVQQALYEAGIVSAFSAGNNAGTGDGAYFGGDSQNPFVISVAAYDDENGEVSGFSSRGRQGADLPDAATWDPYSELENGAPRRPDIAAPGDFVFAPRTLTGGAASLSPRVDAAAGVPLAADFAGPYAFMSGTSMAAPHVSGAAAVLWEACPEASPLDLMRAIYASASPHVLKTSVPRDPTIYPDQNDWSHGDGPAEPFEVGYGALDVRAALDWLLARNCDSTAAPLEVEGLVETTPAVLDWLRPAAGGPLVFVNGDAVEIDDIVGGPAGITWDRDAQAWTGMPWHAGTFTVVAMLADGGYVPMELQVSADGARVVPDGGHIQGTDLSAFDDPIYAWWWVPENVTADVELTLCTVGRCDEGTGAGIAVGYLTPGIIGGSGTYEYRYQDDGYFVDGQGEPALDRGWWSVVLDGGQTVGEGGRFTVEHGLGDYVAPPRWDEGGIRYEEAGSTVEVTWPSDFEVLETPQQAEPTPNGTRFIVQPGLNLVRIQSGEDAIEEVLAVIGSEPEVIVEDEAPAAPPAPVAEAPASTPIEPRPDEEAPAAPVADQKATAPLLVPALLMALLRRRPHG